MPGKTRSSPLSRLQDKDVLFNTLISTAVDGIIVIDDRAVIQVYNEACERLFGYTRDEAVGQNVNILMPTPQREEHDGYVSHYTSTGERRVIGIGREVVAQRKDGATFPLWLSVGEGRVMDQRIFVGILSDLSERRERERHIRELQSELLHATRLATTGELGAALAHELNQPLTAILNYTHVLQSLKDWSDPDAAARAREILTKIAEQSTRAGEVIRRLRSFVSKREPTLATENLNAAIEESLGLVLIGAFGRRVNLRTELAPSLRPVSIDKVQIQQVIINIIRNALEAMSSTPSPVLILKSTAEDQTFARVTIADNGPGLAPDVAAKLFRPFVTTKQDGLGIGLSICRTIVEAHGGRIWAETSAAGTKFQFRLPFVQPTEPGHAI
jgi:two-component system sensor kinase FixL